MKHTEGKWEVVEGGDSITIREGEDWYDNYWSSYVCEVRAEMGITNKHQANANLIASAPAMLKALKQNVACATNIQNAIEGRYKDPYDLFEYSEANEIVNRSQRIIRKAEKGTE